MINKALNIAKNDLTSNYGDLGIYAGPRKHRQYWGRDGFIASLGACVLGDFDEVKKNLDLFVRHQRSDGHIPIRVEENYHLLTLLGIHKSRIGTEVLHKQSQPWATDTVDSNSWFIISAMNYVRTSGDKTWYKQNEQFILNAASWLISKITNEGLVNEGYIGNWSDCNLRKGYIIYNNVLAWKALYDLGLIDIAAKLSNSIVLNFWDDDLGYFIDRIDNGKRFKYFYSDGNLMAICFGMVAKEKADRILDFIEKNKLDQNPIVTGYPRLDNFNDLINRFIFPMYRTKFVFTLWGCFLAIAQTKSGRNKKGVDTLNKIADKITEYGTCHEVLRPDGTPVDLWFYKSEKKIAWTAGMYIYAYKTIFGKL